MSKINIKKNQEDDFVLSSDIQQEELATTVIEEEEPQDIDLPLLELKKEENAISIFDIIDLPPSYSLWKKLFKEQLDNSEDLTKWLRTNEKKLDRRKISKIIYGYLAIWYTKKEEWNIVNRLLILILRRSPGQYDLVPRKKIKLN